MKMTDKRAKEILAHFPKEMNSHCLNWIKKRLFEHYIIVPDKNHTERGTCSCCGKKVVLEKSKHLAKNVRCPYCGADTTIYHMWRRKYDQTDLVRWIWYDKSRKNKKAIVARWGYSFRRIETEEKGKVSLQHKVYGYFIFYPPHSDQRNVLLVATYYPNYCYEAASIRPPQNEGGMLSPLDHPYFNRPNISSAIKNTPFQYSCWDTTKSMAESGYIRWFDYYSRYPSIEYLVKIGLGSIVEKCVHQKSAHNIFKLRGATLKEVLGFNPTPEDVEMIRGIGIDGAVIWAFWHRRLKQQGVELKKLQTFVDNDAGVLSILKKIYKYDNNIMRIMRWTNKWTDLHYSKVNSSTNRSLIYKRIDTLRTWDDYIRLAKQEGMDVQENLYPKDLWVAHKLQIKRIEEIKNKYLDDKIKGRAKALQKFTYANKDYILRPIKNLEELYIEGNKMINCVFGYADRYAKGQTSIFVLRKLAEENKPFVTVEINNGKIVQALAKRNKMCGIQEKRFLEEYSAAKKITYRGY